MILQLFLDESGSKIGHGDNTGIVRMFQSPGESQVHFGKPGDNVDNNMVPITGETYPAKDTIKEADYARTSRGWYDNVWACKVDTLDEVAVALLKEGWEVSVEAQAAMKCNNLAPMLEDYLIDNGHCEVRFKKPPSEEDRRVSRSWAEGAAQLGNFDSVDEFAGKFDLVVVDDEVLMRDMGVDSEDRRVELKANIDLAD